MTYPKANKKQWFQSKYPGANLTLKPSTMVVVLHTTEGIAFPTYNEGPTAPNYTGRPPMGDEPGEWRAHFPDNKSSRALQNKPGGVETNTLNAVQIELLGTCDPRNAKSWAGGGQYIAGKHYVYWPDATKKQLRWLCRLLAYFNKEYGLVLEAPKPFIAYPGSYGNTKVRLSFDEWHKTVGVVGHQHIPENSHGDPGNINIKYVLKRARLRRERQIANEKAVQKKAKAVKNPVTKR